MNRKHLILILLITILLPACGASSPAGDPLEGTSWQLSALGERSLVEGTSVTLEFRDGQAAGTAGCNGYGGAYQVDGEKITFRDIASTLMLCTSPQGVMEQEAAFLGALNEVERFELAGGRLQLIRSGGEALAFLPAR